MTARRRDCQMHAGAPSRSRERAQHVPIAFVLAQILRLTAAGAIHRSRNAELEPRQRRQRRERERAGAHEAGEALGSVACRSGVGGRNDPDRCRHRLRRARIADRADPVPDEIWNEAARHYQETALSALILAIGTINLWNRLNATTRQPGGEWTAQYV